MAYSKKRCIIVNSFLNKMRLMDFKNFSGYLKRLYSIFGIKLKTSVAKNYSPLLCLGSSYSGYSKYCKDRRKNAGLAPFGLT